MSELYKKMYANLVGDVDDTIQYIGNTILLGECGKVEMTAVGDMLKEALLKAEDMYLDVEE